MLSLIQVFSKVSRQYAFSCNNKLPVKCTLTALHIFTVGHTVHFMYYFLFLGTLVFY